MGSEKPVAVLEMECDCPKANVFCVAFRGRVLGQSFFAEKSVMGTASEGVVVKSSWMLTQRSRVRFPALPHFLSSSGSGTGSIHPL
jgi:hypothetical protein